ncbi:hypothetical protein ES288_A08G039700v1 [Gossypium darwinii]|uniref:Uncharacterized protein n=1 Tax=Gossypium darwinii TaxID=34276 RepID=A0A5D2FHT9_GOSDA|nr:hypothetical protein ES288_A08G039700v1 [Gossypium darwinii]
MRRIGVDLSLCAQSRRAIAMNSVWLREEGDDVWDANRGKSHVLGNNLGVCGKHMENRSNIDPVSGNNLKRGRLNSCQRRGNVNAKLFHTTMEHDLKDGVLIGEEGKKRSRKEIEDSIIREEINIVEGRNRRMVETNNLLSEAAKRQADQTQ